MKSCRSCWLLSFQCWLPSLKNYGSAYCMSKPTTVYMCTCFCYSVSGLFCVLCKTSMLNSQEKLLCPSSCWLGLICSDVCCVNTLQVALPVVVCHIYFCENLNLFVCQKVLQHLLHIFQHQRKELFTFIMNYYYCY